MTTPINNHSTPGTISSTRELTQSAVTNRAQTTQNIAQIKNTLAEAGIEINQRYDARVQELSAKAPPSPTNKATTQENPPQPNKNLPANQLATLQINGKSLVVETQIPLRVGQVLSVQFNEQLALLTPRTSPESPLSQTLLSELNKLSGQQVPMQSLVPKLLAILQATSPTTTTGASALNLALSAFFKQLPRPEQFISPFSQLILQTAKGENTQADIQRLIQALSSQEQAVDKKMAPQPSTHSPNGKLTPAPDMLTSMSRAAQNDIPVVKQVLRRSGLFLENELQKQVASQNSRSLQLKPDMMSSSSPSSLETTRQRLTQALLSSMRPHTTTPAHDQTNTAAIPLSLKTDLKGSLASLIKNIAPNLSQSELTSLFQTPGGLTLSSQLPPFVFPTLHLEDIKRSSSGGKSELSVGELLKHIAGVINRITHNQLHSIYQSHTQSSEQLQLQSWHFDIPIFNSAQQQADIIQLRLDQETQNQPSDQNDKKTKEKQSSWKMTLAFNFDNLGPIFIQVQLQPPAVSPSLWAEKQETLALLKKESPVFETQLLALGLDVEPIHYHQGTPPTNKTVLDHQFVDTRA